MKRIVFGLLLVILLAGTVGCASEKAAATRVPATTMTAFTPGKVVTNVPAPVITLPVASTQYNSLSSSAERMIIRNANLQLVVTDISDAINQITRLAGDNGGFVVNSNIQESQSRLYGNISIRVESKRFNEALAALRALAVDVKAESTSGQDVTEEYTDLSAKLRNLEAAEQQLLELMKQAGKVTEILEVQKELVSTRGEIEQTKGRMQYLEQSSDLALIQVGLEQSNLIVEFTAVTRNVNEDEKIQFNVTVSGGFAPYSYAWDFGDGRTGTGDRPAHAYQKNGSYAVTLKVTDDRGNTATMKRDDYITVLSGWEAGNTAHSAWNGAVGFMHFLVDTIIWFALWSWFWVPVLVIILYFAWWRRRKKNK
jgi:hypothetical protein